MNLINTARALDDTRFLWRVRGALLRTAVIRRDSALPEEITYASYLLANPMQESPTLAAICAADQAVADLVVVDEWGGVNTEAVKDETLIYLAEVNFHRLAQAFTSPASPPPAPVAV